jgi:hypothetical protein
MTIIVNELEVSVAPEAPLQPQPAELPEPVELPLEPLEVVRLIDQQVERERRMRAH